MNKIKSFIFALELVATSLVALPQAASAAGSASLALSPSGSRVVGGTFSVTVVESSGSTAVNGVEADLNYDSSKLQFLSKSCGGAFEVTAPSGAANLGCATITAKTGTQVAGIVSFRVLAAGAGTVSFAPSSQITASDGQGTNVWNGDTSGTSYSFAVPVAAAAPVAAPVAPAPAPVVKAAEKAPAPVVKAAPIKKSHSVWPKVFAGLGILIAILVVLAVIFRKQVLARTKKFRKNFAKNFKKTKKNLALKLSSVLKK